MTSAVQTILERRPDSIPPHNSISDLVEYLFLVWRPGWYGMEPCTMQLGLTVIDPIIISIRCGSDESVSGWI